MELTNEFIIDRPVDETWKILNDLEFIAPCMPGAQLTEIEGDEYRGLVKIKVGPITAAYKGKASFVEQDAATHTARLKAEGRDPRQGNANAMVTAVMTAASDTTTTVNIHTDLSLSGKLASFGRGAIEDVSKKILGQFTDNLRDKLAEGTAASTNDTSTNDTSTNDTSTNDTSTAETEAGPTEKSAASGTNAAESPAEPTIRKVSSPEPEPVDILSVTPDSITKKVLPVLGALVGLLVLRWFLRGRASD